MDASILQLVVTGLSAAGAKPVWDYMSGRTKAKKETEERLWSEIADLKKVITNVNVRLDRAKTRIVELEMQAERERHHWQVQLSELQDQLTDLQANNEALTGELKIATDHIESLREQLREVGQIPRPRPEQPRNPNGTFASPNPPKKGRK